MEWSGYRGACRQIKIDSFHRGVSAMHCIFCEEPLRTVILSLAAIGIVAIIRMVRNALTVRGARETVQ
jgi:hypothetical protein